MSETQKHKKPNVPNLRFPGFEGEWKESTFGDCSTGFDYGMNAASKPFDGEHKYIRITDIDENTSEYKEGGVVSPDSEIDEQYRVNENDILFARTGASTGKTYLYSPKDGRLYYAGFLIRMNVSPQNNARFVFYQTQTSRYKKWVQIMSMRSGQPGINSQEYSSYRCFLPKLEEQQKIANLLTLIDQRISIQNRVIEDLKKLKAALCESMYDENEPNYMMGEIIEQTSTRNGKGQNLKVLSVSNQLGFIEQSEQFEGRTIASQDTSNYKIVSRDDFAYNPARINVGSIARLKGLEKGIVSPMYVCFRCKKEILPGYLEAFFDTDYFFLEMEKRLEGSVRMCLSYDGICNIPIAIPSLEEQKSVMSKIQVLNDKIELEESISKCLFVQKQYLLSQMFI